MTARVTQIAKQVISKMSQKSNIHLYTAQTPNGIKPSIVLEELGLKYEVRNILLGDYPILIYVTSRSLQLI